MVENVKITVFCHEKPYALVGGSNVSEEIATSMFKVERISPRRWKQQDSLKLC
jgi:hypothetical protein